MNVDTEKLEERAAIILGQIQASVAEYVRAMNEAGALRRREIDEAQRQQDVALRALKTLQATASVTADAHAKLVAKLGEDWLGLVERGLENAAKEQARIAVEASVTQIEMRLCELTTAVKHSLNAVGRIADCNANIARVLAWKTIGITALWLVVAAIGVRVLQ